MTKLNFIFISSIFLFLSCNKEEITPITDNSGSSINRIMPLGASRVEGQRPEFESYRYELWKDLKAGDFTFDFIGTMVDEASYPSYLSTDFDADHEGRGGLTSGEILDGLDNWLNDAGSPDIVLFSSPGGNDALGGLPYSDAISNINGIIDALQAKNPSITILIEQPAPAHSSAMTPELTSYFDQIVTDVVDIANTQTTASSQVIVIDMYTGFTDAMLADDVHYNELGADFIATRYYDVLKDILQP